MKATKFRSGITSWKDGSEEVRKRSTIMGSRGKRNGFRLNMCMCVCVFHFLRAIDAWFSLYCIEHFCTYKK